MGGGLNFSSQCEKCVNFEDAPSICGKCTNLYEMHSKFSLQCRKCASFVGYFIFLLRLNHLYPHNYKKKANKEKSANHGILAMGRGGGLLAKIVQDMTFKRFNKYPRYKSS
jgi:hypothetical protein